MPPLGYNNSQAMNWQNGQYSNMVGGWGGNQGRSMGRQAAPNQYMSRQQMPQGQMQRPMPQQFMPQRQMQQGQMQRPMQQMPQQQMPQQPMQRQQMQRQMQQGQMQRPMPQQYMTPQQGQMQRPPMQQMPQQMQPPIQPQMQPQYMPQPQMAPPGQTPMQGMPVALPDGVRMEPLDEKTLKELQSRVISAPSSNTENPSPAQAEASQSQSSRSNKSVFQMDVMEALGQFIQNERNGEIFYRNLADMAIYDEHRSFIEEISSDNKKRRSSLDELYTKHKGSGYSIAESEINTTVDFKNGIALAIKEESRALRQLSQLYEKIKDPDAARVINSILYRKTGDISMLHYIYMNGK